MILSLVAITVSMASAEELVDVSRARMVKLGASVSSMSYSEELTQGKSTEAGTIPGAELAIELRSDPMPFWYWNTRANLTWGSTLYDGTTWSGRAVSHVSPQRFLTAESVFAMRPFAHEFTLHNPYRPWIYAGLGYRQWRRGQAEATESYVSYSEDYQWLYLPIGTRMEWSLTDRFDFGFDLRVSPMLYGTVNAHFSQVSSELKDTQLKLGNRLATRIEGLFTWHASNLLQIQATPWFENTAFGESESAVLYSTNAETIRVREPSSSTRQFGATVTTGVFF